MVENSVETPETASGRPVDAYRRFFGSRPNLVPISSQTGRPNVAKLGRPNLATLGRPVWDEIGTRLGRDPKKRLYASTGRPEAVSGVSTLFSTNFYFNLSIALALKLKDEANDTRKP